MRAAESTLAVQPEAKISTMPLSTHDAQANVAWLDSDESTESEGISHIQSLVLPNFANSGAVPLIVAPDEAEADDPDVDDEVEVAPAVALEDMPISEQENLEYIRRTKVTFLKLTEQHDMDDALRLYDDFLSRPRRAVLDDPAEMYTE